VQGSASCSARAGRADPAEAIDAVKMGTTVATNALLERKGERTGAGDHARLRRRAAHRLPEPAEAVRARIELPSLLYERVIEADERIGAHGEVVRPLDEAAVERGARARVRRRRARGRDRADARATAITRTSARSPRSPARRFAQVSVSHEVSPLMKLVSRGDTTVVDAYLSPILRRYVGEVERDLGGAREGSAAAVHAVVGRPDRRAPVPGQGRDPVGPAGGIVGAVEVSRLAGFDEIIGFDMGGTSTDVTHYAGEYERAFVTEVAGVRLRAPMMRIHTVAAGGGSICTFDGARFRVGPESARREPGPASYRRGGPLA
jgi:5-oxoprolinase (ATP-hydrolysing)